MEADVGKVLLGHGEDVTAVGEEHVPSVTVDGHELMLALFERFELLTVVALYPTGLCQRDGFPTALRPVLVKQTVLYDFKLQLADRADNLASVELVDEQLSHALVHKLLDAFLKLLGFHGIGVLDVLEHFWRERRKPLEMQLLPGCKRIANLEVARIGNTDNIARISLIDYVFLLSHKGCRRSEFHGLARADMEIRRIALKLSRADFNESDTATVTRIHIRMYFEHESCKFLFFRQYFTFFGLYRFGGRRDFHETVKQLLDPKGVKSDPKNTGATIP